MEDINFKRPQLEDRDCIQSYFAKAPSRGCERTFANAYLWARFYQVSYAIVDDTLLFRQEASEDEPEKYSYPSGEPEAVHKVLDRLIRECQKKDTELILYSVSEENFQQLDAWYPGVFQIEYERDYADYVYETEKLATLAGKKLHGKRNHINKFIKTYPDWSYEPLSDVNAEECFQMALRWRKGNGCEDDPDKNAEMCVTLNSLRLYKELGLTGGLLRVNGEVAAFSIGEPVCEDTFVVHIEKAFAEIDGAYPMINQQFVQHVCMNYQYVNREEDVGEEGLRKAKLSYRPAFLVEKGVVTKK